MPGAPSSLEGLLETLWNTEFLGRMDLYRTAILMLADYGIEFGMSKRSKRIVGEILPQVRLVLLCLLSPLKDT